MTNKKTSLYNWKITLKKFLISAAIIILTGLLAVGFNNPWFIALVPFIEALLNWLKNHNK